MGKSDSILLLLGIAYVLNTGYSTLFLIIFSLATYNWAIGWSFGEHQYESC